MSVCECGILIIESYEHHTGLICSICLRPKIPSSRQKRREKSKLRRQVLSEKRLREIKNLEIWNNHYGCRVCGTEKYLTIDHIIPSSKGGQNIMSNKQVLCTYHNNLKASLLPGKNGWWPDELVGNLK